MVATAFKLFGETTTVLRGTAAAVGVAAVIAMWPALRRFGRAAAIAGMAWTAGSLWLICISRDGMRNMLVPLVGALCVAALLRWTARPSWGGAMLAGASIGLGFWTYQPLKLMPLLVVVWLWWLHRTQPQLWSRMRGGTGWLLSAALLVASPMMVTAIADPNGYFGRIGSTTVGATGGDSSILIHVLRTLGMFAVTGDPNQRHDVGALPLLGWPLTLVAALGLWRVWRQRHDPAHALVLFGLPVFLLPPLVAIEGGSPHFLRSLGLAPFLAALIGLGAVQLHDWASARLAATGELLAIAGVAVLLVTMGALSARAYFSRPVADRYDAYSFDLVQLAEVGNGGPGTAVVIDDYRGMSVRFLDSPSPPAIIPPGTRLTLPAIYGRIIGLHTMDLISVTDPGTAASAVTLARAPDGTPSVVGISP